MSADKPFFRFHPGAYEPQRKVFVASDDPCGICGEPCVWRYDASLYSVISPTLCARCISSGAVERYMSDVWKARFSFHDTQLDDADPALEQEVLQQTPGFAVFNPINWPVIDGKPLAYIGHGDEAVVLADPLAMAAIRHAEIEQFDEAGVGASPYAVVFREIDGERHVVIFDYD